MTRRSLFAFLVGAVVGSKATPQAPGPVLSEIFFLRNPLIVHNLLQPGFTVTDWSGNGLRPLLPPQKR